MPPPGTTPKGPRPRATVGGILLIAGGAIALLGTVLPWLTVAGENLNGYNTYITSQGDLLDSPGSIALIGGLIGVAFGIALVAAGRVLAVCILAIVFSAVGVLIGIALLVIVADSLFGGSIGIGLIMQPVGPAVALVGSIVATAKRS